MAASGQYRVTGSRHLEEGEIIGVGQDDGEWVRDDGDTALPEKVQDALDLLGGQMELAPGKHLLVFRQDAIIDTRFDRCMDHEIEQAPAGTGGLNE
jgi:hypothetical protein